MSEIEHDPASKDLDDTRPEFVNPQKLIQEFVDQLPSLLEFDGTYPQSKYKTDRYMLDLNGRPCYLSFYADFRSIDVDFSKGILLISEEAEIPKYCVLSVTQFANKEVDSNFPHPHQVGHLTDKLSIPLTLDTLEEIFDLLKTKQTQDTLNLDPLNLGMVGTLPRQPLPITIPTESIKPFSDQLTKLKPSQSSTFLLRHPDKFHDWVISISQYPYVNSATATVIYIYHLNQTSAPDLHPLILTISAAYDLDQGKIKEDEENSPKIHFFSEDAAISFLGQPEIQAWLPDFLELFKLP